jgi:hypothetical protein
VVALDTCEATQKSVAGTGESADDRRMDRDAVLRWVAGYELSWRTGDLSAVETLFTEDAHYRPSPYEDSEIGHDANKAFWLDDEGKIFSVDSWVFAVDGDHAAVRVDVRYGDPVTQEYRGLWLLRFAADGRVEDYEEWADWPGRPTSAADAARTRE